MSVSISFQSIQATIDSGYLTINIGDSCVTGQVNVSLNTAQELPCASGSPDVLRETISSGASITNKPQITNGVVLGRKLAYGSLNTLNGDNITQSSDCIFDSRIGLFRGIVLGNVDRTIRQIRKSTELTCTITDLG